MAIYTVLDKKVQVLIDLRGYKLLERKELKDYVYFNVETPEKKKILICAIPGNDAIGIRHIAQLAKNIKTQGFNRGMIITIGKYTQAAKSSARKNRIELIPTNSPSFNIFEHNLVPKHEILTPEEKMEMLKNYRVKPYQLPRIKTSDPIAKVIGAKAGDILKITRKSPTAGVYISYRYVVEG